MPMTTKRIRDLTEDLENESSRAANMADDARRYKWATLLDDATTSIKFMEDVARQAVEAMRDLGATWQEVGDAIGVSRQAAWERFK